MQNQDNAQRVVAEPPLPHLTPKRPVRLPILAGVAFLVLWGSLRILQALLIEPYSPSKGLPVVPIVALTIVAILCFVIIVNWYVQWARAKLSPPHE